MKIFNIFHLIQITPIPEAIRLRLRRIFTDRAVDRERIQAIRNGGSASDVWDSGEWQFEYQLL